MGRGPISVVFTGAYMPAHDPVGGRAPTHHFKVTTAVNTVQRLGTLLTVPAIVDDMWTASQGAPGGSGVTAGLPITRPPEHVIFQVPAAAANPIYMTWDNNTAPVVGGPGYELLAGQSVKFENAGLSLLRPQSSGIHQVNSLTAFQFIATAATVLLVHFSD